MRRLTSRLDSAGLRVRPKLASRPRLEAMEDRRLLTTLFVTNTDDAGAGSLRQAILDANATTGSDIVDFNINGSGVHTIAITSAPLPTITDTVLIDATTQPVNGGASTTTPLILIDGSALTTGTNNGLTINLAPSTSPATIRGIAIGGFNGAGVAITGVGGNAVQQSLIGTTADGTAALANGVGVSITGSPNNSIGGLSTTFRNLISGNTGAGVVISGTGSTGNAVQGNLIGVNVGGSAAVPNAIGVQIVGVSGNSIGGAIAAARNVISGNTQFGIQLTTAGASNNAIQGNYIGLNSSGNAAVPNNVGIQVGTGASSNSIGGGSTTTQNVISGNTTSNVFLTGATNNLIVGNFIGLNSDGNALAATQASTAGLELEDGATGNTVGGSVATALNVISGSTGPNVQIRGKTSSSVTTAAANNLIQGNFIGTTQFGTAAASTTTGGGGVVLRDATTSNTIGGVSTSTVVLPRNVISGNIGVGIGLLGAGTTGNLITGNNIGVAPNSTTALANSGSGVFIDGANGNTVGGTATGAGNVIANNGSAGVFVNTGTGIDIQHNAIFSNAGLGIDLAPLGVNPNAAVNPGTGPNNLQNYPVLTSATTANSVTSVAGTLHSAPNTQYTVEFFSNTTEDATGKVVEGRTFLGSTIVTTDANGNQTFSATTTTSAAAGSLITATATDGGGNTSEFSATATNAAPTVDLALTLTATPSPIAVGGQITYTLTVTNNGPSNATNVVVTDTLPTGVSFVGATSSTGSITQSGSTVTATVGSLAVGATATMTITVVAPTVSTGLTNTATATLTETDANQGNNTASVTSTVVQGVDLVVTSSITPSTPEVGQTATITFVVTNASTTTSAGAVNLIGALPANATVVSSSITTGSVITTGGNLTAAIGTLGAGQSATVNLVVTPTATGTLTMSATATTTVPEVNPSTNTATVSATVAAAGSGTSTSSGPRVIGLDRAGFHAQPARITLTFSGALEPTSARNKANYKLVSAGRDGKFNTKDDVRIPVRTAFYDATANTVTLTTRRAVGLRQRVQLTANGTSTTGIRGTSGSLLDGDSSGSSGSNFVQVFSGVGPGRLSVSSVGATIATKGKRSLFGAK